MTPTNADDNRPMEIPPFLLRNPTSPGDSLMSTPAPDTGRQSAGRDHVRNRHPDDRQDLMRQAATDSRRLGQRANAIGAGTNRPIRTQTIFHISGNISGAWIQKRISAPNKDAAMSEAHAIEMRVVECTEIPSTRK